MLLIFIVTVADGAQNDFKKDIYDHWASFSNDSLMAVGNRYIFDSDPKKQDIALLCFTIVSNRYYSQQYDDRDLPCIIKAMNNIGYMYMLVYYDYQKSFTALDQARVIAEKNGIQQSLPQIYLDIALLRMISNETQQSEKNIDETIRALKKPFYIALKQEDWQTMIISLCNMANLAVEPFHRTESIKKEIKLYLDLNLPDSIEGSKYLYYICKATTMFKNNRFREAIEYYQLADRHIPTKEIAVRYHMQDLANMAYAYRKLGENQKALQCLHEGVNLAIEADTKDAAVDLLRVLYNMQKELGMKEEAEKTQLEYLQRKDALLNEHNLLDVNKMQFQGELKKINDQIKEEVQRRRMHTILLYISIGIVVLVAFFLFLLAKKYKEVKEYSLILYRKNEENLRVEKEGRRQRLFLEKEIETMDEISNSDVALENQELSSQVEAEKNNTKKAAFDEEYMDSILKRIKNVMETSQDIYQLDFSLNQLSEMVGVRSRHVSQAIKARYENFYDMLNSYRIKEVCQRFHDKQYRHQSIEAISQSVGFKSRSNFVAVFKKITGLTPSQYQKLSENNQ